MVQCEIRKRSTILSMGLLMVLAFTWAPAFAIEPSSVNPAYWEHEGELTLLLGSSGTDHLFLANGEKFPRNPETEIPAPLLTPLYDHLEEIKGLGANYVRNVMTQRELIHAFEKINGKYDLTQLNDCNAVVPNTVFGANNTQLETSLQDLLESACYWTRFQAFLAATHNLGIFVQIELWDRFDYWSVDDWYTNPLSGHNEPGIWDRSPWKPVNNDTFDEFQSGFAATYSDHPGDDVHPFFHGVPGHPCYDPPPPSIPDPCQGGEGHQADPTRPRNTQSRYDLVRGYQEAFVDKMLSYSLNYDHVLYLANNETSTHDSWALHWMDYVKTKASQQGKTVYVSNMPGEMNAPFPGGAGEEDVETARSDSRYEFLDISQADSNTTGSTLKEHVQSHWDRVTYIVDKTSELFTRPVNHIKVYDGGYFVTPLPSFQPRTGKHMLFNDLLLGAAATRYHRLIQGDDYDLLPYEESIKSVREVETRVKFWDLEPDKNHDLISTNRATGEAFAASKTGEAYVVYFPEGGSVGLNLSNATGSFTLEWLNYDTATWETANQSTVTGGVTQTINAPSNIPWIAVLTLQTGQKLLTVTREGNGSGTITDSSGGIACGSDCTESYPMGTVVSLTASPLSGSTFAGWSGDADCADGVVTMSTAVNCTAMFNLIGTQPLTVIFAGTGSGTVSSVPSGINNCSSTCSADFLQGTPVALTAAPASGSQFDGWSGPADCADGMATMNAPLTCTATFNLDSPSEEPMVYYVDSEELVYQTGFPATNVLDGDPTTMWHTKWEGGIDPLPHDLVIDLKTTKVLSGITYLPRQDGGENGRIAQYEVYVATTSGTSPTIPLVPGEWTQMASGTFPNSAAEQTVSFSSSATSRYVWLRAVTEVNGGPWTSMAEFTVVEASSGPMVYYVDSEELVYETGFPAINVLDGDPITMWHTKWTGGQDPLPHDLAIDLKSTKQLSGISYLPRQDGGENGRIAQYEVYVSNVGTPSTDPTSSAWTSDWGTAVASGTFPNTMAKQDVSFGATVSARYVWLRALTEVNGGPWSAMAEFTVEEASGPMVYYVDSEELVGEDGAAVNALDGNPATRWHTKYIGGSDPLPHDLAVDLGTTKQLSGITYLPRQDGGDNGRIGQYEVYVATNSGTPPTLPLVPGEWTQVASGSFPNSAAEQTVSFSSSATSRYVWLRAITGAANSGPWTSVAELTVLEGTSNPPYPPVILSPSPGSTLTSTTVTFVGDHTTQDVVHSLWVGTTSGGKEVHFGQMTGHSQVVSGLPTSGTIYVRYWTTDDPDTGNGAAWVHPTDVTYTMNVPSTLTISPSTVTVSGGGQQTFTAGGGVPPYTFTIVTDTSGGASVQTATGLYTAGANSGSSTVRVTDSATTPATAEATVTVQSSGSPLVITSPTPGSILTSSTVTFVGGHTASDFGHSLHVGTTFEGSDLHAGPMTNHSQVVSGLPTSGTIYVRYWTQIGPDPSDINDWSFEDHTYTMNVP